MEEGNAALILAKRHSNRLPDKNILPVEGMPMFLVNTKKCLRVFKDVYVSSDDKDILKQAAAVGAKTILRSADLCGDTPNIHVYQHALKHMGDVCGIVAVQANSPSIDQHLLSWASEMLLMDIEEIMTCHADGSIYGSIWALSRDKLENYGDPYRPRPRVLIVDRSIDIHTLEDYNNVLNGKQCLRIK